MLLLWASFERWNRLAEAAAHAAAALQAEQAILAEKQKHAAAALKTAKELNNDETCAAFLAAPLPGCLRQHLGEHFGL